MKRIAIALLMVALLVGATACSQAIMGSSVEERVEKRIPLPKGGSFSLENVNGAVTVDLGPEGEVYLVAEKTVKAVDEAKAKDYLGKMEVTVNTQGNEVKVETVYPKSSKSIFSMGCSGSVAYTVKVPPGTALKLTTVNGSMNMNVPGSEAACETTNGSVNVEAAGRLSATTVNGKVRFSADEVEEVCTTNGGIEGEILSQKPGKGHVETVNGSIALKVPAGAAFTLEAENVNGSVRSTISGLTTSKHSIRGDVNGGGATLSVETVNGSVEVETR
jgi:hypothetical protein